jgi:hypothetical protein
MLRTIIHDDPDASFVAIHYILAPCLGFYATVRDSPSLSRYNIDLILHTFFSHKSLNLRYHHFQESTRIEEHDSDEASNSALLPRSLSTLHNNIEPRHPNTIP